METISPDSMERIKKGTLLFLLLSYCTIMVCSSWLADDAYITLRVVDNFVNGYGMRWNIGERVQVFTHALWFFALVPIYAITHNHYYTPLVLSWALSLISAVILLFVFPRTFRVAVLIGLAIIFSKAYVDYSTSGLENPLTHLLLIGFYWLWFRDTVGLWRSMGLGFLAAMLAMNRHDALILVAPPLLWEVCARPSWRTVLFILLGMTPICVWEFFSIAYYGFPFPNTAYAKLNTAAPRSLLVLNGRHYLFHTIMFDPLTLAVIISAALAACTHRCWKLRSAICAGILYMTYITWAGGDFMGGRFFSAPMLLSLIVISRLDISRLTLRSWLLIILAMAIAGLFIRNPTIYCGPNYGVFGEKSAHQQYHGVNDERSFYYQSTGLLARRGSKRWPDHSWRQLVGEFKGNNDRVHEFYSVGFYGFFAGPRYHIIDILGLGDPLLARITHLGVKRTDETFQTAWGLSVAQGHYERAVPRGYKETLESGTNVIRDPHLREYYDYLRIVISGPLWSKQRWIHIWKFNTGQYQPLMDAYANPSGHSTEGKK